MIVTATPSTISRRVFLDNDLEESDAPSVESVIGPSFPAISLNFLAILVRPSVVSLILSRSCPNKSVWASFGSLFTSIADDPDIDADADADADDADADTDVDADNDDADDDNDDAVTITNDVLASRCARLYTL